MPFGGNHDAGVQPYKYNGKEFDTMNGIDQYDYHARQYDPVIPSFTGIDPLAEKYYSWSLYVYCANNPLKYIDPTGMTIWQINELGNLVGEVITTDADGNDLTFDRIEVLDKDGNVITQTNNFELGPIKMEQISYTDGTGGTIFTVGGTENATNVFETLANPDKSTKVEWMHQTYQTKEGGIKNFVLTGHEQGSDNGVGSTVFKRNLKIGNMLTRSAHNHPVDSPIPAGLYLRIDIEQSTDITVATSQTQSTTDKFGINKIPK